MPRYDGTLFTGPAIARKVYLAGLGGRRPPVDADRSLGTFWMPARPRPLRVIPDYRTNTTRPR
jgi:hypothetical protein